MNTTLTRFNYPSSLIREHAHWVVLIRPTQVTLGCAVIAAKTQATSLGELRPEEAAELPAVIQGYEQAVRAMAPAVKFNYLALMMVDPNPHFHAIPRYSSECRFGDMAFIDSQFPKPPDLLHGHVVSPALLEQIRAALAESGRARA